MVRDKICYVTVLLLCYLFFVFFVRVVLRVVLFAFLRAICYLTSSYTLLTYRTCQCVGQRAAALPGGIVDSIQ